MHGPEDTVAFRLWPPVAIGAPLLVGWLVTLVWGDPVDLGEWRVPLGWALALFFVGWNGWSLWLFAPAPDRAAAGAGDAGDHRGGTLPRLPQPVVRRPAGALPRAGVAGTHVLGTCAVPGRGAARPLGRDPSRGAVSARAVRSAVRRLHAAGASLAVTARLVSSVGTPAAHHPAGWSRCHGAPAVPSITVRTYRANTANSALRTRVPTAHATESEPMEGRHQDEAAIGEVARAYLESWLDGNGERMRSALHPMLAKRGLDYGPGRRRQDSTTWTPPT